MYVSQRYVVGQELLVETLCPASQGKVVARIGLQGPRVSIAIQSDFGGAFADHKSAASARNLGKQLPGTCGLPCRDAAGPGIQIGSAKKSGIHVVD